jgi:hypothetical protein
VRAKASNQPIRSRLQSCNTSIYQGIARISEAEVQAVQDSLDSGGAVVASGTVGDNDELFRMRLRDPGSVWPPVGKATDNKGTGAHREAFKLGRLRYDPEPLSAQEVIDWITNQVTDDVPIGALGNVSAEAMSGLRVNAWFNDRSGTMTVHVLNYNVPLGVDNGGVVQSLPNVEVSAPLPGIRSKVTSVLLYSPGDETLLAADPSSSSVPFQLDNGLVKFHIPNLSLHLGCDSVRRKIVTKRFS